MIFSEKFINSIDNDPAGAIVEACTIVNDLLDQYKDTQEWSQTEYDALLETAALIDIVIENNSFHCNYSSPPPSGDIEQDCKEFSKYINNIRNSFQGQVAELKILSYKNRFKAAFKSSFAYEFSQGDLNRIQVLVNELRAHITGLSSLEPAHKRRLLSRLEKLQLELHKRVSDLDRFWGMVGDAGVVLGKLGSDAKPIVDRVREISEIVWRTQARAEELSSDFPSPLIEHHKTHNKANSADVKSRAAD